MRERVKGGEGNKIKRGAYNTQNPNRKKSCLSYTNMGKNKKFSGLSWK